MGPGICDVMKIGSHLAIVAEAPSYLRRALLDRDRSFNFTSKAKKFTVQPDDGSEQSARCRLGLGKRSFDPSFTFSELARLQPVQPKILDHLQRSFGNARREEILECAAKV